MDNLLWKVKSFFWKTKEGVITAWNLFFMCDEEYLSYLQNLKDSWELSLGLAETEEQEHYILLKMGEIENEIRNTKGEMK